MLRLSSESNTFLNQFYFLLKIIWTSRVAFGIEWGIPKDISEIELEMIFHLNCWWFDVHNAVLSGIPKWCHLTISFICQIAYILIPSQIYHLTNDKILKCCSSLNFQSHIIIPSSPSSLNYLWKTNFNSLMYKVSTQFFQYQYSV